MDAPETTGYQKLGKRTLWLMMSEQLAPSVIIFLAAAFLTVAQLSGVFAKTMLASWGIYLVIGAWLIMIFVFLVTFFVTYLVYDNYLFMLDEYALKIRRGIIGKEEIAIPYRQIQDVDIEQSIGDRMWGVARLVILTAGREDEKNPDAGTESEGIFPALARDLAESLQAELLKRTNIQEVSEEKEEGAAAA